MPPDCGSRVQENPAISPLGGTGTNRFKVCMVGMHGMRFNMGLSGYLYVNVLGPQSWKATITAS